MSDEVQRLIDNIIDSTGPYLPRILAAIVILIVGWIIAVFISRIIRKALEKMQINRKSSGLLAKDGKAHAEPELDRWISKAIYYLIMLFVLVAALQALQLAVITVPLNNILLEITGFIPNLIGAIILAILAWVIAYVLKAIVIQVGQSFGLDDKVKRGAGGEPDAGVAEGDEPSRSATPFSRTLGEVVFWLVILFFLPAILGALGLQAMLTPVAEMIERIFAYLPRLFAAAVILLVGWFVAKLVARIVTSLLAAAGLDRLGERMGMQRSLGQRGLSGLVGLFVFIVILIPVVLAALDALALRSLTDPTTSMLTTILDAVPRVVAAALVLVIAYVVGRLVAQLVSSLLAGAGFNALPARLGIGGQIPSQGDFAPANAVGYLILASFLIVGVMAAAELLGFDEFGVLIAELLVFASQILFGLLILVIGIFLANFAARMVRASGVSTPDFWAMIARLLVLFLFGAIALRQMGVANEIIILAFAIPLGAVAVAFAVAMGVGARGIAARELDNFIAYLRRRG